MDRITTINAEVVTPPETLGVLNPVTDEGTVAAGGGYVNRTPAFVCD
ncbi:hypothetical protein [Georgenia sp. AZ-5]